MKLACLRLTVLIASLVFGIAAAENSVKALTGGTMIDGYGGPPLRNSVIIVEGSKIKAIGQVGTFAVPVDAEVISTEGMTVLPGLWDMHVHVMLLGHADYAHWDATYPGGFRAGHHAGCRQAAPHGGHHERARPGRAAGGEHQHARCDQGRPNSRADALRERAVSAAPALPQHRSLSLGHLRRERRAHEGPDAWRVQVSMSSRSSTRIR